MWSLQFVPYIKLFIYVIKANRLTLLEEIIAVYSENNNIPINSALCWQDLFNVKAWGSGRIDPCFLDLGTIWRWLVSFTSRSIYPWESVPRIHSIGGWVGPRAGLDNMEEWKFLPPPGLELQRLDRPARSQSLYRLRYPGSLNHKIFFWILSLTFTINFRQIYSIDCPKWNFVVHIFQKSNNDLVRGWNTQKKSIYVDPWSIYNMRKYVRNLQ
jgi:hypothetical protein